MNAAIKRLVRGIYDIQDSRIRAGNRLVNHYLAKMGMEPGKKNPEVQRLLFKLKKEHQRLTDLFLTEKRSKFNFKHDGLIDDEIEFALVDQYFNLLKQEKESIKALEKRLEKEPIYVEFLKKVKGVGPLIAGVIVSEIDIARSKYVSSLWRYAGLDVVNGEGRSRKESHLVEREYVDKNGKVKKRKGLSFNPFLKTKLTGVLGPNFLKTKSEYAQIYYDYRNRLENSEKHKDKTDMHKYKMSIRYMIKMFLKDLYVAWRSIEGLPVAPPYAEAKLGLKHRVAR